MTTAIRNTKGNDISPGKTDILKKLELSTKAATNSNIIPLLKKKGAMELTITELRKQLSSI